MLHPLIGVSACAISAGPGRQMFKVGDKYVNAVASAAGATPVMIPPLGPALDPDLLIDRLDGLFLTGSPSNVAPEHYDGPAFRADTARDAMRDATTLPLIRKAIARGLPLLAVCRGHQELNVALGGSLHQHVQELPGKADHRRNPDLAHEAQYEPAHEIRVRGGGPLAAINGGAGDARVNSLHAQAIDRLARPLRVEAESPDGVIEAVSMPDAPGFVLGVQWHPEHPVALRLPLNRAIFAAFGEAARAWLSARTDPGKAA